jgi:hypothetical protein
MRWVQSPDWLFYLGIDALKIPSLTGHLREPQTGGPKSIGFPWPLQSTDHRIKLALGISA